MQSLDYIREHRERFLAELIEFASIPSVSTDPSYAEGMARGAAWVAERMRKAGLENVRINPTSGHSIVTSTWTGAPDAPTILVYGHYDVQPPDPLDEWKSPPFEPQVRGNDIFARGASDDKGQTYIQIKAVEGLLKSTGKLPVNVKFLIEGEEESGGEHIEAYVRSKPPRLKADAAVVCDTEMFAPELPTICVGLRGIVYGELFVEGANHDLHSGVYGGAAPNPIQAIAEILCALKDRDGHIRIPGFSDRVVPPTAEEREAWKRLPFNEKEFTEKEMGARQLVGEPGVPVLDRLWARPTLEVHGIRGGFIGEGAKTVIPARAVAKISTRLVGAQRIDEAAEQLKAAIKAACPKGVTAEFKVLHAGAPSLTDPNNRFIHAAADAMKQVFGKETVYIRSGGSIPIVGVFDEALGIPSVMMGFGLPDDNLHAPNEKFHLPNFFRGIESIARYLEILGG